MNRPQLEVADIIRGSGADFIARNRSWLRWTHLKVLLAIARCRTAALGGHIDKCTSCGFRATISYNSCRNRHCPLGSAEGWFGVDDPIFAEERAQPKFAGIPGLGGRGDPG